MTTVPAAVVPTSEEVEALRHRYLDCPTDARMQEFVDAVVAHMHGRPIVLPVFDDLAREVLG